MRKCWGVFWISFSAAAAAFFAAAAVCARISWILCALTAAAGSALQAVWLLRFRSITYEKENGNLMIRSGVFVRSVRIIKTENILWQSVLKIGSLTLLTAVHTAGGTAVLFCDLCSEAGETANSSRDKQSENGGF